MLFSYIFSLIFISIFKLQINQMNSTYLTMELLNINNCIPQIYYNNTWNNFNICECNMNELKYYPKPLINNLLYKFEDKIIFIIKDLGFTSLMKIIVFINEYIIECKHQKFWRCTNCSTSDHNYIYNPTDESFYFNDEPLEYKDYYFSIYFQINSSDQLNFEGNNVSSDFYALRTERKTVNIPNMNIDKEIELINFKDTKYFFVRNNSNNISIDYTNYYFKIYYTDNSLSGKYFGLNLNNSYMELKNESFILANDSKGLSYKLSYEDKRKKGANLFFQIEGYNCPYNTNLSKLIAKKTEYNFNISINVNYSICLNEILPYYYKNDRNKNYMCLNLTKDIILQNISQIIQDIEFGQFYEIKGNNIIINIIPLNSSSLSSLTNVNFSDCERLIINSFGSNITILDIQTQTTNSLDNQTLYQFYDSNKKLLNLSICNYSYINISESLDFPSFLRISPKTPIEPFISTTYISTSHMTDIETFMSTTYTSTYDFYNTDNSEYNNNDILSSFYSLAKEELVNNLPKLMKEIIIGESYEIQGEDYNIKISPTTVSYLSNTTHVNFEKCEKFLRYYYNISESRYITFLQLEIYNTNSKVLVNKVEYQAYDDNKEIIML